MARTEAKALGGIPGDNPPPFWRKCLSRQSSGGSSYVFSSKFAFEDSTSPRRPSASSASGEPCGAPPKESRSVKELLDAIPALRLDVPLAEAEGPVVSPPAPEQGNKQEIMRKIEEAKAQATAAVQRQLAEMSARQRRCYEEQLQAMRQQEQSDAMVRLQDARQTDGMAFHSALKTVQQQKQMAVEALQSLVQHDRSKMQSMESEIALLRAALKKTKTQPGGGSSSTLVATGISVNDIHSGAAATDRPPRKAGQTSDRPANDDLQVPVHLQDTVSSLWKSPPACSTNNKTWIAFGCDETAPAASGEDSFASSLPHSRMDLQVENSACEADATKHQRNLSFQSTSDGYFEMDFADVSSLHH